MEKDAYYFPHFCNARHDRKIRRLRKELGLEGYGIFFMVLEILREQIDFRYPMDDIDLLSDDLETSEQKVRTVISNYGLFDVQETDEGQYFFSPKLIIYLEPYFRSKEQRSLAGKKSAEKRRLQLESVQRPFNDRSTTDEQSKVKESKVKESKVKESKVNKEIAHDKLVETYGEKVITDYYERIKDYSASTGKTYKDLSATARNWIKRDLEKGKGPKPLPPPKKICPACGSPVNLTGCNICLLEVSDWNTADLDYHRGLARKRGYEC